MQHSPPVGGDIQLPICVFPPSLSFYLDDTSTHQRVLKVYNPCESVLRYRVLSTAVRKYQVIEAEGIIKPHAFVDILIRHREASSRHIGTVDKFRIQVYEHGQRHVIGKSTVSAVLLPSKAAALQGEENFESLPPHPSSSSSLSLSGSRQRTDSEPSSVSETRPTTSGRTRYDGPRGGGPHWIVVCIGLVCLAVLALPAYGEPQSVFPDYMHCSYQWKLVAAYFLGVVTMAIFTSSSL